MGWLLEVGQMKWRERSFFCVVVPLLCNTNRQEWVVFADCRGKKFRVVFSRVYK
jgi:hypothetical protein